MRRGLAAAFLVFCGTMQALGYTEAGGRYTAGPDGYSGLNAFAEWGTDDYFLRPSVNTYSSDLSDRMSSYTLGGGLEKDRWSGSAELSMTPETGGYDNYGVFADLSYGLVREPGGDSALEDASLGIFAGYTAHEDIYAASTTTVSGPGRGSRSSTLTSAFKLGQTDYGVTASLKLFGVRASGRYTKTAYDKDINETVRQLPVDIGGIGTSGFPDTAVSARLRVPGLPVVPEAGYTRTAYLLDQPDSTSLNFGLSFLTGPAEISAGWEIFYPGGGAAGSNYYSVGLTWSFRD